MDDPSKNPMLIASGEVEITWHRLRAVGEVSAEIDKLRAEVADWRGQAHRSQSDADRLESENAELRKDAERYRDGLTAVRDFCKMCGGDMLKIIPLLDAAMKGQT